MNETNEKMLGAFADASVARKALAMALMEPLQEFKNGIAKAETQALTLLDLAAPHIWQNETLARGKLADFKARNASTLYLLQTVAASPTRFGKLRRDGYFRRSHGNARYLAQDLLKAYQDNVLMVSLHTATAVPNILALEQDLLGAMNGLQQEMHAVYGDDKVLDVVEAYEERAMARRKVAAAAEKAKKEAAVPHVPFDPFEPENYLPNVGIAG